MFKMDLSMGSTQKSFKEIRRDFEQAAATSPLAVTKVTDRNKGFNFWTGHYTVTANVTGLSGGHPRGPTLSSDRQPHVRPGGGAAEGRGPVQQSRGEALIPPPVRKFTTTNPNTLSPTYHLFYDLTTHLPVPPGPDGLSASNGRTSTLATSRTDLSLRVSGYTPLERDDSNVTLGHSFTTTNHDLQPTFTTDQRFMKKSNKKSSTRSNLPSDFASHHQDSFCELHERQHDVIERTHLFPQETPLPSRTFDAKFADIKANASDSAAWVQNPNNIFNNSSHHATRQDFSQACDPATNISALVVQKQTGSPATQGKSQREKTEIRRDETDKTDPCSCITSGVDRVTHKCSNCEFGHLLAFEEVPNVAVENAVSFRNSNAIAHENSLSTHTGNPEINSSQNFKSISRGSLRGDEIVSKHPKRAVFKRDGDSMRMFMVKIDAPCNDDSGVASDGETFQETCQKTDVTMSSTDCRKNSNNSLLSLPNILLDSLMSKSKKRGNGATRDRVKSVRGVVTINNDLMSGGSNHRVSKNQVNRWNNLQVRSAPSPNPGVEEEKRKGATKGKLSAQSVLSTPSPDSDKPGSRRDPACQRTVGSGGGRTDLADNVGPNGTFKPAIKGILVNKDSVSTGNRLFGHTTHKVNTVQFKEDPVNIEENWDSSDRLKPKDGLVLIHNSSLATSQKEVFDRSKYIIKRNLVIDDQQNLNPPRDTPLSALSDSLDNLYPASDRITPQAISFETSDSSVKSDSVVDARQSTLDHLVEAEHLDGQSGGVTKSPRFKTHWSEVREVDNSGFLTGDIETYTPGCDKQYKHSSTGRTLRERQELSKPLGLTSSHVGGISLTTGGSLTNQLERKTKSYLDISHSGDFDTVYSVNVEGKVTKCAHTTDSKLSDLSSIENKANNAYSKDGREIEELICPPKHHPSVQPVPQKIRPRQKFEIRHNKIAGKVGAPLRLNSQVSGDASQTKHRDQDIQSDPARVAIELHKESPRARFERGRAARTHAVTFGDLTSESLCERFEGYHKSEEDTLLGLIIATRDNPVNVIASSTRGRGSAEDASSPPELPPPKLPPRVKLASNPVPASPVVSNTCGRRASDTDNNSISFNGWIHSYPDIKPSEVYLTSQQQQNAVNESTFSDETFLSSERKCIPTDTYFITADTQIDRLSPRHCDNSDKENIHNRNSRKDSCCDSLITASEFSCVGENSWQTKYEQETLNGAVPLTEELSNQNAAAAADHFGQLGFKLPAPDIPRVSHLKKVSPDSVSSSGYDSEVNTSAIKTFFQGVDCARNNEYIRQVLTHSSVQQLRLLFGHEDDHRESVKPRRPRDTGAVTSSPTSRWSHNDVSQTHSCLVGGDSETPPPVENSTDHLIINDGLKLHPSSGCQVKQNEEADNFWDSSNNVLPECCSNNSPSQHLGTNSIDEFVQLPVKCAVCDNPLERRNSLSGTAPCSQEIPRSSASDEAGDIRTRNSFPYINIRTVVLTEAEAEMLASKGIRIYESGDDYVAMVSPVKSPLHKSLSSPQFVWEGTTYLIIPTVLDPVGTSAHQGNNNNPDLVTHRSISDSGAPGLHPDRGVSGHYMDNVTDDVNDAPVNERSNVYLTMTSSGSGRLTEQSRAMSVEVLCAKDVTPTDNHATPPVGHVRRRKNNVTNDRGYVEWKTCSGWVGNTDMRTAPDCRNSQGYVEWDTIWTAAAPWRSPTKGDDHVYDVIAEDQIPQTQITPRIQANGPGNKESIPDDIDTPPALPERTYIHRIKNANSGSQNPNVDLRGAATTTSSRHNHSGLHPRNCGCYKHHHHHHHHHSGKHHRSSPSHSTTSTTSPNLPPAPMQPPSQQHKHTGGVHTPATHDCPQLTPFPGDPSQNYAEVNKLRGYSFSNLMPSTDSPTPRHPDKTAISSENYWHLAPMTSPDSVTSWQTGDVLDYIDGLHDSMSSKRRENIYILLNNKKTRAKFSESLEIESKLLSRGLLSNFCEGPSDKAAGVTPKVKGAPVKPVVVKRKGAVAPVSSTYV